MDGDLHKVVRRRDLCREIAACQPRGQCLDIDLLRAESDHQGTGSRHRFFDALDGITLKRGEQRQRFIEIGEFDKNGGEADGKKTHYILTRDRRCRGYR